MKRILLILMMLSPAGCGDGKATVCGKVTLDGEAVPDGSVTFVNAEGGQIREGAVIKDGVFEAKIPPGKYRIELNAQKAVGKRTQKGFDGKDEEVVLTEERFPERYNTRSELIKEIPSGPSTLDLTLDSKK